MEEKFTGTRYSKLFRRSVKGESVRRVVFPCAAWSTNAFSPALWIWRIDRRQRWSHRHEARRRHGRMAHMRAEQPRTSYADLERMADDGRRYDVDRRSDGTPDRV